MSKKDASPSPSSPSPSSPPETPEAILSALHERLQRLGWTQGHLSLPSGEACIVGHLMALVPPPHQQHPCFQEAIDRIISTAPTVPEHHLQHIRDTCMTAIGASYTRRELSLATLAYLNDRRSTDLQDVLSWTQ